MEYRYLGKSGLRVSALSFGTATFGGSSEFFKAWGTTQVPEAKRLIDLALEMGVNLFDTADVYSNGLSEEILGQAIEGNRQRLLISTKATFPMGEKENDYGSSRLHLIDAVEKSLKRLRTDHIDLYHMHGMDAHTPIDETMRALDDLVRSGKVRYIAASNFSGWHMMKSLALSDRYGWSRYVGHQVYYSLVGRDYEWELGPLGAAEGLGAIVWSPLAAGALTGKIRRGVPAPKNSRLGNIDFVPYDAEKLYKIIDVVDGIAKETGKSIAQVVLNWTMHRPTVATLVVGARNEEQLKQNLASVGWRLTPEQTKKIDEVSAAEPPYPYWHQQGFPQLVPNFGG